MFLSDLDTIRLHWNNILDSLNEEQAVLHPLLQVWINDLADILALKCIKPTEHNE